MILKYRRFPAERLNNIKLAIPCELLRSVIYQNNYAKEMVCKNGSTKVKLGTVINYPNLSYNKSLAIELNLLI